MNSTPAATSSLLRFSIGVSRVGVRNGSHIPRYKKPQPEKAGFWPGHGERIWVFNHLLTNQIIYSTKAVLDSNRALKQLPFNGKKTKPAKLRKDYWKPMAIIQFAEGAGDVGRSVFQKLREFKRSHELEWGYQTEELYKMSKPARGVALNNQKANAIADMAAVLGGAGRGNLMWRQETPALGQRTSEKAAAGVTSAVAATGEAGPAPSARELLPASIYWANTYDPTFVKHDKWPKNVTHFLGLDIDAVEQPDEELTAAASGEAPAAAS